MKRCRLTRFNIFFVWVTLLIGTYTLCGKWIQNLIGNSNKNVKDTIHLVAVSCGRPNYQGVRDIRKPLDLTLTMVKSAVLFAQSPLHVHIFTEDDMMPLFEAELSSWSKTKRERFKYKLYQANYDEYLPPSLVKDWKKWYKPCGSFRLFLPMILKDVTDAAIYTDSDVVFLKPIDQLWQQFASFNERQVASISPTAGHPLRGSRYNENFISHSSGLFQVNTGIMMMNFTRMLNSKWRVFYDEKDETAEAERMTYGVELLLKYYEKYKDKAEHDQKLLNIMYHYNPDLLRQLSCSWNFKNNFCSDENNVCSDAESLEGASAVHGITSAFFGDVNPTFRALYEAFLKFDMLEGDPHELLQTFKSQLLSKAQGTYCAEKSDVISRPLARSVKNLMTSTMNK
uniref:UDP-D-xylose:beta-D-glucoside alpha-1,3-D-xylosyltransferase n=1 Tax=Phallusia mammillata TaxID=59560 RepID=A0A6F9DDJ8_9ASCI|nr:glucoside xylosyltransferase 1-like [Phallusia mammillata]